MGKILEIKFFGMPPSSTRARGLSPLVCKGALCIPTRLVLSCTKCEKVKETVSFEILTCSHNLQAQGTLGIISGGAGSVLFGHNYRGGAEESRDLQGMYNLTTWSGYTWGWAVIDPSVCESRLSKIEGFLRMRDGMCVNTYLQDREYELMDCRLDEIICPSCKEAALNHPETK